MTAPAVLVHPPGVAYRDVFLPALEQALGDTSQPLLVVVGHVNPNRVALLHALAETGHPLTLATSNAGAKLLNELWHQRKPSKPGDDSPAPPFPRSQR